MEILKHWASNEMKLNGDLRESPEPLSKPTSKVLDPKTLSVGHSKNPSVQFAKSVSIYPSKNLDEEILPPSKFRLQVVIF